MTGFVVHSASAATAIYVARKGAAPEDDAYIKDDGPWTIPSDMSQVQVFATREEARAWAIARYRRFLGNGLKEHQILAQATYVALSLEELAALLLKRP